jgi:hypothetical protein
MDPLGTDSCRGTVPMEPPMSNGSMRHQNPNLDFDDTRVILQGTSCTIAAVLSFALPCAREPAAAGVGGGRGRVSRGAGFSL